MWSIRHGFLLSGWVLFSLCFLLEKTHAAAPVTVTVPAGELETFWIAPKSRTSENSKSTTKAVQVSSFQMMKHPVTNQEFLEFLKKHPDWKKSRTPSLFVDSAYLSGFDSDLRLKKDFHPKAPVVFVSWFAAKAFCEAVEMRLPTTVEWEYAAAASEKSRNALRDPEFLKRILSWYGQTKDSGPGQVGSGLINVYGIQDLHGLVWEWVDDFNSNLVTGESRSDSSFNRDLFCGAGGLGGGDKENYAAFMRFAFRSSLNGRSSIWNLGFRCVR